MAIVHCAPCTTINRSANCPEDFEPGPLKYEILPRQFNQSFFACDKHLGEVVKKALLVFGPVEVKDV